MCRNKNLLVLQQFLLLRPLPLAIPLMIWMGCVTVHFSHRVHLAQICQMLGKLNCQFNIWTLFYLKNMKMLCRKMMVFFFFLLAVQTQQWPCLACWEWKVCLWWVCRDLHTHQSSWPGCRRCTLSTWPITCSSEFSIFVCPCNRLIFKLTSVVIVLRA